LPWNLWPVVGLNLKRIPQRNFFFLFAVSTGVIS
jgi:hypothetical protein